MGRKGGARHLKRMPAPRSWPIHVKELKWVAKPLAGPHRVEESLSLLVVLRDLLRMAKNAREAKKILARGKVKVDGKVRKDERYPVGLMDVVEIADAKSAFRVIPSRNKGLTLVGIPKDELGWKLCSVENKTTTEKGRIQLNLHDGRNVLVDVKDSHDPVEDIYDTADTIQLAIPNQKILDHIKYSKDSYGMVIAGRNIGRHGRVVRVEEATATRRSTATIEESNGEVFQTTAKYVFIMGRDQPLVRLEAD